FLIMLYNVRVLRSLTLGNLRLRELPAYDSSWYLRSLPKGPPSIWLAQPLGEPSHWCLCRLRELSASESTHPCPDSSFRSPWHLAGLKI
ncbi:hypothetical protein J6590_032913, partial [Homalodisca vitripennis]